MTWRHAQYQRSLWKEDQSYTVTEPGKEIFEQVFRNLRPRTPLPEFEVIFRPYADINNVIRLSGGKLRVGLSDLLKKAPRPVLEALATILISKLYRKPIPKQIHTRYRQFLNRQTVRRQAQKIREMRGRKWIGVPQGMQFDLSEMFDQLNRSYFDGLLSRPRLSWSRTASHRILGHFDSAHNAIIISRIFDRPETPRFLVEYILYHEMLHVKHPVIHHADRRCFHSSIFRKEEKRFPQFAEAKTLLNDL